MKAPSRQMRKRLADAAELRAMGAGWPAVADRLKCRAEVCRRWPNRYPYEWDMLYEEARRRVEQDARAEALHVLLTMMRSRDEKTRDRAARILKKKIRRAI